MRTREESSIFAVGVRSSRFACEGLIVLTLLALAFLPSSSSGQAPTLSTQDLVIQDGGITVSYPEGWSVSQTDVPRLLNVPAGQQSTLDAAARDRLAQIAIFVEHRKDHAEAVMRLREIAAETDSPSTFLAIGGWPALQRRFLAPKPHPLSRPKGSSDPAGPPEKQLNITTAVAAGDLLVRLDGHLLPTAAPGIAEQIEAIARSLIFHAKGDQKQVDQEVNDLRSSPSLRPVPPGSSLQQTGSGVALASSAALVAHPQAPTTQVLPAAAVSVGGGSELSVAASSNAKNIVIGSNFGGYYFSTNSGQTWRSSTGLTAANDPQLACGQSGTFYAANISGNSTSIDTSPTGQTYAFRANAFTCPGNPPSCGGFPFPDQEQIAADRVNAAAGGDRVYSLWRNGGGSYGIVCSANSGTNWSGTVPASFTPGDFGRINVGPDGFVYVVYLSSGNIMLNKYNRCDGNPMQPLGGFPVTVATGISLSCPIPGLDRCTDGSIHMVAVDDTNPNHVYVTYAGSSGGNENVVVQDSINGGSTWSTNPANGRITTVNTVFPTRRFMPWVCSAGGAARVTWYDRRASTPCPSPPCAANNDLTDFFAGSASLNSGGTLVAGTEFQVNAPGSSDAQCAAGATPGSVNSWPSGVISSGDSESCSVQPQLAGRCCLPCPQVANDPCVASGSPCGAGSDLQACDFSSGPACAAGESCVGIGGSPKYGDYNGNACAAGRLLSAWASATPAVSLSSNINIFFASTLVSGSQINVPGNLAFPDTCVGSTNSATLNVCNTGVDDLEVKSISSSSTQFAVTSPTSGYPVVISPDFCFPFQVRFTPFSTGAKTTTLTIASNDLANPTVTVQGTGNGIQQEIRVTGSTDFGNVCADTSAQKTVSACNVGKCDLHVTGVAFDPACTDFTLINNPFPAPVSPDSCLGVVVRFTPTLCGPKTCTLKFTSDDPDSPVVPLTVTANTPCPSIDVAPDLGFPPTVISSVGACSTLEPFPVSNTGTCPLKITGFAIATDATEYSLSGLPSFPILLEAGHEAGEGDLTVDFAPDDLGRARAGTVKVTYVSDPISGATTDVTRLLCGEGVRTGARVLVTAGGVPLAQVEQIKLQRINANRNKSPLDTLDNARNLALVTETPAPPCGPFQYHREYGTVSNPVQLLPGSYSVTVTAIVNGHRTKKTVGFDVTTCDFNPTIVVNF